MSTVWVIVAVVAIVAFAAFVLVRRRVASGAAEAPAAPEAKAEQAAAIQGQGAKLVAGEAGEAVAAAEAGPEAAPVPGPPAEIPARPQPSPKEMRSRVEERLAESERMLGELRKAIEHDEALAHRVGAGTVEIMAEGLQEVQSLAERKKWDQARDKGEALHAQLSLMLQSARD